jgi:hypothetical protein
MARNFTALCALRLDRIRYPICIPRAPRAPRGSLTLGFCVSVILGGMLGCNFAKVETLAPVVGTVKVQGKPLTLGWITFYPDEARGNTNARLPLAEITTNGTYELTTNGKPGAPPGFYKVVIAATRDVIPVRPPRIQDGKPAPPNWLTHEKYTKSQSTDLLIEVVENPAPGAYDLEVSK